MNKLSLKWKISVYMFGFSGFLVLVLWLFQAVFLDDMYMMIRRNELLEAVSLVEENINNPALEDMIYDLAQTKEIYVTQTKDFRHLQEKQPLMDGKPPLYPQNENKKPEQSLTLDYQFEMIDGRMLELTFHGIISPVDATVHTLMIQLYMITGIMIVLSIIISLIIGRRIAKPIEDINESAKFLISESEAVQFEGKGFLEIAELSHTLNEAAKEISKVETLRRELIANISHDLKTPIALIYSYAEMMIDFPEEIKEEQIQVIMDEASRLTTLVRDALDISKIDSGAIQVNKERYNLTQSIRETIQRMKVLTEKDGYTIIFEPTEEIDVYADKVKITQVFYNLLINAITHTGENKTIIVKQIIEKENVTINVKDYGKGIAKEHLEHIWERYYKIDKTHKRSITGTGLGLSIVKKIIRLHQGTYGVYSEEGKGSNFWFRINTIGHSYNEG